MSTTKNKISAILILILGFMVSCQDLEELNVNPNGVDPANANPSLLMSTIVTYSGINVVGLGFGDIAGGAQ